MWPTWPTLPARKFAEPKAPAARCQPRRPRRPRQPCRRPPLPRPRPLRPLPPRAAPQPHRPAQAAAGGAGGEALYKQTCVACHAAGVAGAPKFGDKAAWAPRLQQGLPVLVQSAIKGKGAMPPKGGSTASEQEIRAAVEYMVNAAK